MNPKVSIIILNWNGWKDTIECLESLYQIDYQDYNVVVVDNASSDGSIEKIREYCEGSLEIRSKFIKYNPNNKPIQILEYEKTLINNINIEKSNNCKPRLTLIKNDKNYGFAEGNNICIKFALKYYNPDYMLLLNNDTVVDRHFLSELVKIADSDEKIGSVQSLLLKPGGNTVDSLGQKISIWGAEDEGINLDYTGNIENAEIFGACAAAALYRRETLEKVGLFDEDFFVMLEDLDLSWRIRLNGSKSILASKSIVYHKRGISEKMNIYEVMFKNSKVLLNWYHGSKNWLIIVIKYYSFLTICKAAIRYPHKFFFTFFRCIFSSLKISKAQEVLRILLKNLKVRKEVNKNPLLKKIQSKWIR